MNEKKPIKLFSWQKYIVIGLAVCGGVALSMYRSYTHKGYIDKIDVVIMAIAVQLSLGIVWGVVWWGNRPEKDE